ncbi:hypothetical protein IIA16_00380 [bacterium]|nr:hypothetical protein [bacterium]
MVLLLAGLAASSSHLRAGVDGTIYDPWPPRLGEEYYTEAPGDALLKPVPAPVMREMAEAVLALLEGAIGHVDAFIVAAQEAPDTFNLGENIWVYMQSKPYEEWGTMLVVDYLVGAGDESYGRASLALVRGEMHRRQQRLSGIVAKYGDPVPAPSDAAELEAYLSTQTTEAKAIHEAVDWALQGREYVVAWTLNSLHHPVELVAFQESITQSLEPQYLDLAERDFGLEPFVVEEYLRLVYAAEMEMEAPYAAEEKRLIDAHTARYLGLAEQTRVMVAQLDDQIVEFVESTPSEWGEVPFNRHLFNPIRYRTNHFYPFDPEDSREWGFLPLRAEFWSPPGGIEQQDGFTAWSVDDYVWDLLADNPGVVLVGEVMDCRRLLIGCAVGLYLYAPWQAGRDLAIPVEPQEPKPPEYPQYALYLPPTVPEVELWGAGLPGVPTEDWSYLVPEDVIAEHELDGDWIVMGVYGQSLFAVESKTPILSWAGADRHLEYKLLHTGKYSADAAMGRVDPKWQGFWGNLHTRQGFREMAGKPPLPIDHADFYIVAVRLTESTWAGRYSFKLGDLEVGWTLPHARNRAETSFVRLLGSPGEALDYADVYEQTKNVFSHDRFYVEIATSGEVATADSIPFELFLSRDGGPATAVMFKTAGDRDSSTLTAHRVGDNRQLFRSEQFFVQAPDGLNAWSTRDGIRTAGIGLAPGDRLAARVVPHGVASQAALGLLAVHTTPADVGASWREAVVQAANLMGKTPPKAWERLSKDEFNAMLRTKWGTVDSTPFVQVGGRQIDLALGDLAAMLLIRERFNLVMGEALPEVRALRNRVNEGNANSLAVLREEIRADASHEGFPLAEIRVADPGGPPLLTVPFRLVYDEEWMALSFRDRINPRAARERWLEEVTVAAVSEYYRAAVNTYRYSMGRQIVGYEPDNSLNLRDPKEMLRLTAIGMGPIAGQIKRNLLRLVVDPTAPRWRAFSWEVDGPARSYVGTIQALGVEFHNNEALIDQYNAMAMAVAGGAGLLPGAVLGQSLALLVGAGSLVATLAGELPDYLDRSQDVEFALGAYQAVGEERYITAALRRKSGWAVALELAGGAVDVVASVVQLRHARAAWVAAAADAQAAELFAGGPAKFVSASRDAQQSALVRLAQLSDTRQSGRALSELEETVLESGGRMLDEVGTVDAAASQRYLDPTAIEGTESFTLNDGRIAFVSPPGGGLPTATVAPPLTSPAAFRIPENTPWHIFDVKTRLGRGAYAQVFEIAGAEGVSRALKVYAAGPEGLDDVQRALRAEAILAAGDIPQLRIIDHGVHDGMAYIVQEIMPPPGIYKPVKGQMMDSKMAEALLGLYQKLGEKGIGWSDGWWANIYFFREVEGGPLVAGVLDQDRVWKIGEGIGSGVWGGNTDDLMVVILRVPGNERFRIDSLARSRFTPAALDLLRRGFSPWPDADFFMMKMLEHKGWINYNRDLQRFESGRMDIGLVRDYFPRLERLESINPMFDIPDHLRPHGPDLPIGELPDSLGGANLVPDEELALAA